MEKAKQHSFLFSFFSNILYYMIAFPVLKILTKIVYDLKIEGIENIRNIDTPVVSVSNHVLVLDCAMVGLAYGRKKVFYTTQEESFEIPFVKNLIKLLRAIPIPKSVGAKKDFIQRLDGILNEENCVHFYPEGVLLPYCKTIRAFKKGAFSFAVRNNTLVVPMVFHFREPVGIRKIFKRKKDVTLVILEPIECNREIEDIKQKILDLKERTYQIMNKTINKEKFEPEQEILYTNN